MKVWKMKELDDSDLILSFKDIVNFEFIDEAATRDFPKGNAAKSRKNPLNKHEPYTSVNQMQRE
jgi:hypothetical protein